MVKSYENRLLNYYLFLPFR